MTIEALTVICAIDNALDDRTRTRAQNMEMLTDVAAYIRECQAEMKLADDADSRAEWPAASAKMARRMHVFQGSDGPL